MELSRDSQTGRVNYLDTFRYLVVTFAIVSHVLEAHDFFGEEQVYVGVTAFIKSMTRMATPSLIILFGMMVELVYRQKFSEKPAAAIGGLMHRALLCYLAFLSMALVMLLQGEIKPVIFLRAVEFLQYIRNASIFKLYTVLLLLMIPLLFVRSRTGVWGTFAVAVALWLVHPLFLRELPGFPQPYTHLGGLMFGLGDNFGPSAVQGVLLVVFGMSLSGALVSEDPDSRTPWLVISVAMAVVSAAVVLIALSTIGFSEFGTRIANIGVWRNSNNPIYYAYGILGSLLLLGLSMGVARILRGWPRVVVNRVGGVTLMYFAMANITLQIVPTPMIQDGWALSAVILFYVALFTLLGYLWSVYGRHTPVAVVFNRRLRDAIIYLLTLGRGSAPSAPVVTAVD